MAISHFNHNAYESKLTNSSLEAKIMDPAAGSVLKETPAPANDPAGHSTSTLSMEYMEADTSTQALNISPTNATMAQPVGNLSIDTAPSMVLPGHMDGYIDVDILINIHKFLKESGAKSDRTLADWIKENYLYEPINEEGRSIRTIEGFAQLERAYRRVRLLTNKTQDKWPFFDRTWKKMTPARVKNNARGEESPGVPFTNTRPVPSAAQSSSTTSDPQAAGWRIPLHHGTLSRTPISTNLNAVSATNESCTKNLQNKNCIDERQNNNMLELATVVGSVSQAAQEIPIEAGSPAQTPNALSHQEDMMRTPSQVLGKTLNNRALNIEPIETELLSDAVRGKVRGRCGRFVLKLSLSDESTSLSPSSSTKPANAGTSSLRSRNATLHNHTQHEDAGQITLKAVNQEHEGLMRNGSQTPSKSTNHTDDSSFALAAQDKSRTLAAEDIGVDSNLDRLPPGSVRGTKRKNAGQNEQCPQKCGRHIGPTKGTPVPANGTGEQQSTLDTVMALDKRICDHIPPAKTNSAFPVHSRCNSYDVGHGNSQVEEISEPPRNGSHIAHEDNDQGTMVDLILDGNNTITNSTAFPDFARSPALHGGSLYSAELMNSSLRSATGSNMSTPGLDLLALGCKMTSPSKLHSGRIRPAQARSTKQVSLLTQESQTAQTVFVAQNPTTTEDICAARAVTHSIALPTAQALPTARTISAAQNLKIPSNGKVPAAATLGTIKFFAQIHTVTGLVNVPILSNNVKDATVNLLREYTQWRIECADQPHIQQTSFEQYCSVVKYNRKP